MLWNIVKGVVAAVLVTKITERYFKDKNGVATPVQSNEGANPDLPGQHAPAQPGAAKPRTVKPSAVRPAVKTAVKPKAKPEVNRKVNQELKDSKPNYPLNATESSI